MLLIIIVCVPILAFAIGYIVGVPWSAASEPRPTGDVYVRIARAETAVGVAMIVLILHQFQTELGAVIDLKRQIENSMKWTHPDVRFPNPLLQFIGLALGSALAFGRPSFCIHSLSIGWSLHAIGEGIPEDYFYLFYGEKAQFLRNASVIWMRLSEMALLATLLVALIVLELKRRRLAIVESLRAG